MTSLIVAVLAVVTIAIVITRARRQVANERALNAKVQQAQSELVYQSSILDTIGQAVIAIDGQGRISYINRTAEMAFECTRGEAMGQSIASMMFPEESVQIGEIAIRRMLDGHEWNGEITVQRKDGHQFPIQLVAAPVRDANGHVVGAVGIASDLTERRRGQEEERFLSEASEVLSATLDVERTLQSVARLAVRILAEYCLVDLYVDGKLRRVGAAHREPALESLAENLRQYPPDAQGRSPIATVLETGEPILLNITEDVLNTFILNPEHRTIISQLGARSAMVVPISARGNVLGVITYASSEPNRFKHRDLALAQELARRAGVALDNAQLYSEAQTANQAKSDFLAVVSHELRTPLTTIMGYTDLLLAGVPETLSTNSRTYVDRVRRAAWHLLGLIEQILIYARMEAGRDEVHPTRIELGELAKETAGLIEPIAAEKGLRFTIQYPPPPSVIETDLTKVRQILLNLLSNAVKFTSEGEVRLQVDVKNGRAVFRVTDTGHGISSEHVEQIFDPFWQVEQPTTRSVGGAGLGLSVSRRLARLLGGDVHVITAPGAGSTFVVELPTRYAGPSVVQ